MLHPLLIENKVNICIAFNTKVLCTDIFILEMSKLTFNIFAQSHKADRWHCGASGPNFNSDTPFPALPDKLLKRQEKNSFIGVFQLARKPSYLSNSSKVLTLQPRYIEKQR